MGRSERAVYRAFTARPHNDAMRLAIFVLAALATSATAAWPASLIVTVRDQDGRPVSDAVATLKSLDAPARAAPIRFAWPTTVDQRNIKFDPFVLVVPVGAEVSFPNRDKVRHHVYSFSPVKVFQLKLYGREESRSVTFDRAGVVPLGCNIHDQMIGFVDVVDTPWAGKTGADGETTLQDIPAGRAQLIIWRPYMKSPRNQMAINVTMPPAGVARQAVSVVIGAAPARGGHL